MRGGACVTIPTTATLQSSPRPSEVSPLRRAFSLSGVLPLGAFLVFHLGLNARALSDDDAFARTLDALHHSPGLLAIEALFVYLPLIIHAAVGIKLVIAREPLVETSPHSMPTLAALRATGVVVAIFLALHLWEMGLLARGQRLDGGALATVLAAQLASTRLGVPWRGVGYLLAVGCVAFHFAVGCWGMVARSPRVKDDPGRRRIVTIAAWVVGLSIGAGYTDVVVFQATGMRLFGGRAANVAPGHACPP